MLSSGITTLIYSHHDRRAALKNMQKFKGKHRQQSRFLKMAFSHGQFL